MTSEAIEKIDALFYKEANSRQERFSATKDVRAILNCSPSQVTNLRRRWNNNGTVLEINKRPLIKDESAIALANDQRFFESQTPCKSCSSNMRYTKNGACVNCINKVESADKNKSKRATNKLPNTKFVDLLMYGNTCGSNKESTPTFILIKWAGILQTEITLRDLFEEELTNNKISTSRISKATKLKQSNITSLRDKYLENKSNFICEEMKNELIEFEINLAKAYRHKRYISFECCPDCGSKERIATNFTKKIYSCKCEIKKTNKKQTLQ